MKRLYEFLCKGCDKKYEEFAEFDEEGIFPEVNCPFCESKDKQRLFSGFAMKFDKPQDSSKWDSFSYRAGYNLNKAQDERRQAEHASHMGSSPYRSIDDTRLGEGITDFI